MLLSASFSHARALTYKRNSTIQTYWLTIGNVLWRHMIGYRTLAKQSTYRQTPQMYNIENGKISCWNKKQQQQTTTSNLFAKEPSDAYDVDTIHNNTAASQQICRIFTNLICKRMHNFLFIQVVFSLRRVVCYNSTNLVKFVLSTGFYVTLLINS